MYYKVQVEVSKQEDNLWRVEAPDLQGCFVDAETLEQAMAEIHEVIAMVVDIYLEDERQLPANVMLTNELPVKLSVLVSPGEHIIRRFPLRKEKSAASPRKRRAQP